MNLNLFFEDFNLNLKSKTDDFLEYIDYRLVGNRPPHLPQLPNEALISWDYDKKSKTFFAEYKDKPGVFTSSGSVNGIIKSINQAIYNYFEVPRYWKKRLGIKWSPRASALQKVKKQGATLKTSLQQLAYA